MSACIPIMRDAPARELIPSSVTVTDHAQVPLIGANPDRRSLLIVNTDATNSVHLVRNGQGQVGDLSYELKPGEGITLAGAYPVYAVTAAPGLLARVKMLAEHGAV